jgi:hypothetical protein
LAAFQNGDAAIGCAKIDPDNFSHSFQLNGSSGSIIPNNCKIDRYLINTQAVSIGLHIDRFLEQTHRNQAMDGSKLNF